jgi:hypothetical protein
MLTGSALIDRLIAAGMATPSTIIGCNDNEIALVEENVKIRLPEGYKDFLLSAGKCAGAFRTYVDWLYPEILWLTSECREELAYDSDGMFLLPEKAFVFEVGNAESFSFFDTARGTSNPPVFGHYESHRYFDELSDSFWEYVEAHLEYSEKARILRPQSPLWSVYEDKASERARQMRNRVGVTEALRRLL